MLFTSRSLYAANFIAPVSVHSLTVPYLPVLVTLQPRYTFRVLAERRSVCARVRSTSSVLRASSSGALREIISLSFWIPTVSGSYRRGILNESSPSAKRFNRN